MIFDLFMIYVLLKKKKEAKSQFFIRIVKENKN